MLHRPGGSPRARKSSASHAGVPDARGSSEFGSEGALAIRQRMRAPLRLAWPPSRIKKAATPDRSEATASRRVAVKSSTLGSPHNSPMTQDKAAHLRPSSIAQSASLASRASTWMRSRFGNPGGWTRPDSRIAIRSWIHSIGLVPSTCASMKPAQPPSRGCAANSSDKVGLGGAGKCQRSPNPLGRRSRMAGRVCAETAPPATRDKPLATRLTTFLFYFCSLSGESDGRVNPSTRVPLFARRGSGRSRSRSAGRRGRIRQMPCVCSAVPRPCPAHGNGRARRAAR